ncbi:MAG: N-acetylmuramoyl-L-alanine amidase [Mycobacterium sp.]|nr:N-acetylmuramoyl-L-alanine amidase [Mycobacterium sp.]
MGASPTDLSGEAFTRRRLLRLAGVAGVAVTAAGCAARSVPAPTSSTGSPATPSPVATGSPPPQQVPEVAPLPVTAATGLVCREGWGARPARPGGRPHIISRMTLHHTEVVLGDNRNITTRLRQHQRYHQDQQGWVDIAYHLGVDRNGNIFELRTPEIAGDTATSYDPTGHFLVVCEGDFNQEAVTEAQLHGAAVAFAWAAQTFGIATDTLAGHRDVASTTCPGANLQAHITSGGLQRRVEDLIVAGPVDLQQVCGPEAAAVVAAIEAG